MNKLTASVGQARASPDLFLLVIVKFDRLPLDEFYFGLEMLIY